MNEVTFARRELQVEGSTLRYAEAGAGDAVVCFDGILGLRPSRAHALLAARHRVVVIGFPDLPTAERGQPAAFISAVGQALEQLGIERFDVMGHGAGALLALSLAVERPDAVNTMVLLGAVALPPVAWSTLSGAELKAAFHAHPERHPEALPQGEKIAARLAAAQRFVAEGGDALRHRMGTLTFPVLALFGTGDPIAPLESADRYRAALADCNLFFVYDAAHAIDIDRPEAVAFLAQEFFERRDLFLVSRENGAAFP